ncbi:flavodoxin family protein [uncultured Clostridium sp.]|uniref:flavodoxin family protein n=1 Tax=uncultured Clostridium sp. TaxID=59620 RepID=UPI0025CD055B|nr:flavodoxin family protein [uncultured Clostridium sp.]
MKKDIAIFISSVTGNTLKIASRVKEEIEGKGYNIILKKFHDLEEVQCEADLYILCFWCRRSTLDDLSQRFVSKYKDQKILAFGTMGNYPDSEYGDRVRKNVIEFINGQNKCEGVFLSRGKIPVKRTEYRRNLPKDHPHYLNEEGYKRHIESRNHPNEDDMRNAVNFLNQYIADNF